MVVAFLSSAASSSGNAQTIRDDDDADGDDFDDDSVKRRSETNEKEGNAFIKEETEETNEVLNPRSRKDWNWRSKKRERF